MVKAVVFDLDGTLVDSMWMWKDIDMEFLSERGFDLPPTLQKEIEGMIICASENQEILPNIQKIYSSEIINKIKVKKYCIKLTLE